MPSETLSEVPSQVPSETLSGTHLCWVWRAPRSYDVAPTPLDYGGNTEVAFDHLHARPIEPAPPRSDPLELHVCTYQSETVPDNQPVVCAARFNLQPSS